MATMKAWVLRRSEDPSTPVPIEIATVAKPEAGSGEALVKVCAVGLNPVDYKLADGSYFWPHDGHILGLDVAGVVEQIDTNVSSVAVGDRVLFHHNLLKLGGYAEYCVGDVAAMSKVPDSISFETAAAIPCAGYTAWQGVNDKLHVKKDDWVVITGGGGGVGGFAIQLAKAVGAKVITTGSKDLERLTELGADYVINYRTENVVERIMQITDGYGADGVFDTVSADSAEELLRLIHYNGGIVCAADRIRHNITPAFTTSPSLHELALGSAYCAGQQSDVAKMARLGDQMLSLVASGALNPLLSSTIAFDEIRDALMCIRERHVSGKIVAKLY